MPHVNFLSHMASFGAYIFTLYYSFYMLHIPFLSEKFSKFDPGQLKYLTIWDVVCVRVIACVCLVCFLLSTTRVTEEDVQKKLHVSDLLANGREMRQGLAIGFHTIFFLHYAFGVYYDYTYTIVPATVGRVHSVYGGKFKFLTFWDAIWRRTRNFGQNILQAIFFLICLMNDIFGTNTINPKKTPFVRKLKDYFHASLGFPVAMFVGVTFWALMFVDRELVLPKAIDPYFPWWLNHLMHTMIMVTTIFEMIIASRQYPKRYCGLGILATFMLTYLVWIHVVYYKSGVWVYPVMDVLSQPLRIVFFAALLTFCTVLYFVGEALNNFIWGNEHTKHKKSHAKSK